MSDLPDTMRAAALDAFDGPGALSLRTLPVPRPDDGGVLVRVHTAGVGVWDPYETRGAMADLADHEPTFPYVPGSDASGTVVATGDGVEGIEEGDQVCAVTFMNPKGGSYAEYVAVDAERVIPIPGDLDLRQAGALPVDGVTALRGLQDALGLERGERLAVFGASGGVGHLAIQLGKLMGARVLAVASGRDGVVLAQGLGADEAVDGKGDDVRAPLDRFAPDGLDAVLATAHGPSLTDVLDALRPGGRVAWPHGVEPEPTVPEGSEETAYDGDADAAILAELGRLVEPGPFRVHVSVTLPLSKAREALQRLDGHFLGKIALSVEG